jgi:DNA-directed RNA polymerase subunit RPC12/RpoP
MTKIEKIEAIKTGNRKINSCSPKILIKEFDKIVKRVCWLGVE